MSIEDRCSPPWTADQVESLNAYQQCDRCHPFTGEQGETLLATPDGWRSSPNGPVSQKWAHAWMADWSWRGGGPAATGKTIMVDASLLQGALIPYKGCEPMMFITPMSPVAYMPCFTDERLLRMATERLIAPFDSLLRITDAQLFLATLPATRAGRPLQLVIDPTFKKDGSVVYTKFEGFEPP